MGKPQVWLRKVLSTYHLTSECPSIRVPKLLALMDCGLGKPSGVLVSAAVTVF